MSSNENTPEPSAEVRRDRLSRMVVRYRLDARPRQITDNPQA